MEINVKIGRSDAGISSEKQKDRERQQAIAR